MTDFQYRFCHEQHALPVQKALKVTSQTHRQHCHFCYIQVSFCFYFRLKLSEKSFIALFFIRIVFSQQIDSVV